MSLFNLDLPQYAMFAVALIFVLGLIFLLTWILRRFSGVEGGAAPFSKRTRRLKILEGASLGNRQRLVLVQRDNVEHLLLVGGATDLVVERGITRPGAASSQAPAGLADAASHVEPRFGSSPYSGEAAPSAPESEEDTLPDLRPGPRPGEA